MCVAALENEWFDIAGKERSDVDQSSLSIKIYKLLLFSEQVQCNNQKNSGCTSCDKRVYHNDSI